MTKQKRIAFLTGITGQDASYLAELLLEKGYEVHGLIRRSSSMCNRKWIDGLDITLHYGDLTDANSINGILNEITPDEIYNLGAQSHVGVSFENPTYTMQVNTIGTLNLLEWIRTSWLEMRMYQASTSEMLAHDAENMITHNIKGKYIEHSLDESSEFKVHSPYAVSKLAAHQLCKIYREAYGIHVSCGILFNHESERRGDNFVTQKIVKNLVAMKHRKIQSFELGNIYACRDWGHAGEYVEAMWLMLQQDKPDDYVIATNESHSVKEFIEECCRQLDLRISYGERNPYFLILEKDTIIGETYIFEQNKRPWDVDYLRGDASKAKRVLGWEPTIKFKELIKIMIEEELKKYE